MGSVLRRDARPPAQTERGRVTAVNDDGTVDVTVGDRPYPYAGIRGHSGVGRLALGDMVEIGFIDRHLHGRKWLPLIVGHSGHYSGSGSTVGPMGGALSWHYSFGFSAATATRQLYRTDTPYTSWRLDTSWSIPAITSYVAYTLGGTGYIVNNTGTDLTCYYAESATQVWTVAASASYLVFNEARSELIAITGSDAVSIINPVDGTTLAGPTTVTGATGGVFLGDRLVIFGNGTLEAEGPSWAVWTRQGNGTTSYASTTTTTRITPPGGGLGYSWAVSSPRLSPDGLVPVNVRAVGASSTTSGVYLLDVETGGSTLIDLITASGAQHTVKTMGADGRVYGFRNGDANQVVTWTAGGSVSAAWAYSTSPTPALRGAVLGRRLVFNPDDAGAGVDSIYSEAGTLLWTPADGVEFEVDDMLWGGESGMGGDPWVLLPGSGTTPAQPIDDTWEFRDPRNGNHLGDWAGGDLRMVAAGNIYDQVGSGELRRWVPA